MKIFKKVTLISIMILYVLSIKVFAATGKVNVSATRLRKENNTTSEILTNIYEGEKVEILEENGEWIKVKYKTQTGFIMKKYVDIEENKSTEENKTQNSVYEDKTNTENETTSQVVLKVNSELRLQPNFMSKKTESLVKGINLTVIDKIAKWIKVTDGTVTGWIIESKVSSNRTSNVTTTDIDSTRNENTTNSTNTTNNNNTNGNSVTNTNTTTNTSKSNTTSNEKVTSVSVSKKGIINVETAKVRKGPSKSNSIVDFLDYDDEVSITEEAGDWYYVTHGNIKGYVNKSLITLIKEKNTEDVTSRGLTEERKNNDKVIENNFTNVEKDNTNIEINNTTEYVSQSGISVVEYAKQFLGYPYVLGGKTPDSGFDCSGFTRYVYQHFGYSLASVAASQTNVGREITREELEPGDLILFYNDAKTKIGHTGIFLGNGDFIHSANPERGVVIDNINTSSYYNQRFVTARRIVE